AQGKRIGLVPTMGYLHRGHLSLVQKARQECDIVITSIFVNPTQFGQGEDFDEYPRDLKRDTELLAREKADAVFAPSARDMYPPGASTFVEAQGPITEKMCGAARPGHFRGVTTVVSKLFLICQPDKAYFGQKDAQQAAVIEKMVRELNFPVTIVRGPIIREADGLAMSSRNVNLTSEQRKQATVLNRALQAAALKIGAGQRDGEKIKQEIRAIITAQPQAAIDYIEIYRAEDLGEVKNLAGEKIILALAVKFGNTRLIDNLTVEV
ncbi:MAG: pantoate--beta-alanine ligase, partial [Syntrophomonadaceae bacterium]|nr:pantoate--beta-alanine ligase [Syntrophomonadaceae bacterium]